MEEKERYEIVYFDNDTRWKIIDNKTKQTVGGIDDMIKLLNQQYKENQQLKHQLHDLPKKIVGEIKEYLENHLGECDEYDCTWFDGDIEDLDTILKKYGDSK